MAPPFPFPPVESVRASHDLIHHSTVVHFHGFVFQRRFVEDDVFSRAGPEFDDVALNELVELQRRNLFLVDECPIGAVQVHEVRPHHFELIPARTRAPHLPELDHRVLLAAARVVRGDVRDLPLPPEQVHRLAVDVQDVLVPRERLLVLEDVKPPMQRRHLGFRRLGVHDLHALHCVRVCGQFPREAEVGPRVLGPLALLALRRRGRGLLLRLDSLPGVLGGLLLLLGDGH
mmetsp:Transcript_29828/g.83337  ORF Transcript_29828/g.83337 Transcript_29828/m.83337 type:complete len:231 (-) Transcript_29828:85-777(-)